MPLVMLAWLSYSFAKSMVPGLYYRLGYSSRLLVRYEWDEIRTNVDIHTLVWELSITRQDIRDILISLDSGLIYWHVSESFKTRREQVESVEDEANVPFTLSFLSCLVLSRRECKPGIIVLQLTVIRRNLSNRRFRIVSQVLACRSEIVYIYTRCGNLCRGMKNFSNIE